MKRRIFFVSIVWIALVTLSSCTTVQFAASKTNQIYQPRTPAAEIELFRSAAPSKKYFEIGAVSACCSSDSSVIIDLLRKKASESGGDALIGLELHANGGATASVIRYE